MGSRDRNSFAPLSEVPFDCDDFQQNLELLNKLSGTHSVPNCIKIAGKNMGNSDKF